MSQYMSLASLAGAEIAAKRWFHMSGEKFTPYAIAVKARLAKARTALFRATETVSSIDTSLAHILDASTQMTEAKKELIKELDRREMGKEEAK